jgi:uncharacterized membrane protein
MFHSDAVKQNKVRGRVPVLDILRGLALVNMVLYHLLYDLVYVYAVPVAWFSIRRCFVWQQAICYTFIIVSGISFTLAQRPVRNGLVLAVCALGLTAVTTIALPSQQILFGVLHLLAAAALLTALLQPLLGKIPPLPGFCLAAVLFVVFRSLPSGYLLFQYRLPPGLYQSPYLFFLGLPAPGFYSADYFPLLPWYLLYLVGYYAARYVREFVEFLQKKHSFTDKKTYRALDNSLGFLGRHSLIIYLLHQPLLMGVLYFIFIL